MWIFVLFVGLVLLLSIGSARNANRFRSKLSQMILVPEFKGEMWVLRLVPLAAFIILHVWILFVLQDQLLVRVAHGMTVLGLWTHATFGIFLLLFNGKMNLRRTNSQLLTTAISIMTALYVTPLTQFLDVFTFEPMYVLVVSSLFFLYGLVVIFTLSKQYAIQINEPIRIASYR
ncbi:hypothetical protein NV379_18375 [Paenibacillus sp. N1-5-1-14]|uniref:hypothetical protein n=1 Tax=Paenibacillus radicibacter TaxID=2972488 RepID=UPI0021592445|nr:hypothetical protein [Paenibacillus radicibacter]MCR8644622.1 hypothetical protein [Paenibacillus radicibacter]